MVISWHYMIFISSIYFIHGTLCSFGEVDLELRLGRGIGCERSHHSLASAQNDPGFHQPPCPRNDQATDIVQVRSEPPVTHVYPGEEDASRTPTSYSAEGDTKESTDSSPDPQYHKRKRVPGAASEEVVPREAMPLKKKILVMPVIPPIGHVAAPMRSSNSLQIISLAPLHAIGVPKVLPTYSSEKKLTILAVSSIYGQTISSGIHEILVFKHECSKIQNYSRVAKIAKTIQNIVDSMGLAFGADMLVHSMFSNYGDRVFPELVAMHLKGIDEEQILNFQKHLLRKWTYLIDFIRFQNRSTRYGLLLTCEPAIELLDAMIRANWDPVTLEYFVRDLWVFSGCRTGKHERVSFEEALTSVEWFVKKFVSAATTIGLPDGASADRIQEALDDLVRNEDAYTVCFGEPEQISEPVANFNTHGLEQSSSTWKPVETTLEEDVIERWAEYLRRLAGKPHTRNRERNHLKWVRQFYEKENAQRVSTAMLESAWKFESIQTTPAKDLRDTIMAKLICIRSSLEEKKSDSTNTEFIAWDSSFLEPTTLSIPSQHKERFQRAQDTTILKLTEVQRFLHMLSSQKDDRMSEYSYIKLCEVFALSHKRGQDDDRAILLLAELLPMLILGNHSVIPNERARYRSTLRHILEYVYIHSDEVVPEYQTHARIRRTVSDFYEKTKSEDH